MNENEPPDAHTTRHYITIQRLSRGASTTPKYKKTHTRHSWEWVLLYYTCPIHASEAFIRETTCAHPEARRQHSVTPVARGGCRSSLPKICSGSDITTTAAQVPRVLQAWPAPSCGLGQSFRELAESFFVFFFRYLYTCTQHRRRVFPRGCGALFSLATRSIWRRIYYSCGCLSSRTLPIR